MHQPVPAEAALVASVQPFIAHLARRYAPLVGHADDLIGAGTMGALEAARRFDPARGVQFVTYAGHWIRSRILAELRVLTGARGGGAPSIVPFEAFEREAGSLSSEAPANDDRLVSARAAELTWRFLDTLDERSREVLRRRFLGERPETLGEVAERLALSRERIRQIERAALELLRKRLRRAGVDSAELLAAG
jgi:RNA polymerase sigma factor (sigma-70 family)